LDFLSTLPAEAGTTNKPKWEHRFAENMPLYMEVRRGNLTLHLSEHHGDASPGATVFVRMIGIDALAEELRAKNYPYNKPGVETDRDLGAKCMEVNDPFDNRIRFWEDLPAADSN
jgi:ribosomal-protein-alanine N-acetyltransferase